jgi:anhydro-N-acetylmuramic acid kinase
MDKKESFRCLGLMSGTSLDGLDIAYCVFEKKDSVWSFSVEQGQTIRYCILLRGGKNFQQRTN